jgi:DNA-binding NarL/FixJ family response regulator
MKLFIADDSTEFRERLASILSHIDGVDIVGQAGDVPEAIEAIEGSKPDTVILDIQMPGGSGLDVLKVLKSSTPSPVVMMLTVGPSSEYKDRCFAMGADYFFEKSSELRSMAQLLRDLAKGSGAAHYPGSPAGTQAGIGMNRT